MEEPEPLLSESESFSPDSSSSAKEPTERRPFRETQLQNGLDVGIYKVHFARTHYGGPENHLGFRGFGGVLMVLGFCDCVGDIGGASGSETVSEETEEWDDIDDVLGWDRRDSQ